MTTRQPLASVLLVALGALTAPSSYAADLTWDGDAFADITNISANWDSFGVWFDGSANVSFSAADNVTFTASGSQTYQVFAGTTGPYTVGNMVLNSTSDTTTGININAPAIDLTGSASTAPGHTGLVQITGIVSGPGSFTLGSGELRLLNNANTFSGGITLNGGTLRVGNGSGSGIPQTAGSLGTGTFTINGGTIFQNQGNGRTQAVAVVIGGNVTFNSVAGGGLLLGSNNLTRSVILGDALRTITVAQNADGTGSDSVLGLRDLTNTAGGAIVKEGAGILRIQGTSTAPVRVNAGSVEVSGALGATQFTMNSGTVWRKTTSTALTLGSSIQLNNASLVNRETTTANLRNSVFQTLQVSGTSHVFPGQGLTLQSTGPSIAGFNVRNGGILGGNGTLRTAATHAYSSGSTTLSDLTDSAITLSAGGSIRPGTPDSLDTTTGDLTFGSLTWNGEASAIAQMFLNLGAANDTDTIVLTGSLTKGTGTNFLFDFNGYTTNASSTFTVMTFASQTGFVVEDFTSTGITLTGGATGAFVLDDTSLNYVITSASSPSAYATWLVLHFTPAEQGESLISGDLADPDGDGLPNLAEYALGREPRVSDASAAWTSAIQNISGSDYLTLTFRRLVNAPDLAYEVQSTSDLTNLASWTADPVLVGSPVANGDGTETVTYRDSVEASSAAPRRFLRVQITRTP